MILPAASLRWPFSIGWLISVLTSITSPFLAVVGTRRRGLISSDIGFSCSAAAAADRDLDFAARHVERAVVHLGHRDQLLGLGETGAELHLCLAARRCERVGDDTRVGVALGRDVDRLHP